MIPSHLCQSSLVLVGICLTAILISGCRQQKPQAAPTTPQVSIDNFIFNPAEITVPVGTTVTWVNRDDVPHTVTADDKQFHSTALDTDDRFTHVFSTPGTYPYFCSVHPHMTGRIIVK